MKTISKGLILALVIQFALVLPFVNIVGAKKAKAQQPVQPTNPALNFTSPNASFNNVRIRVFYGASNPDNTEFIFNFDKQLGPTNFMPGDKPRFRPPGQSERVITDSDTVKLYKLNSPQLSCVIDSKSVNFYLIGTRYSDDPENKFRFSGIYSNYSISLEEFGDNNSHYFKLNNLLFTDFTRDGCNGLYRSNQRDTNILMQANSSSNINSPIVHNVTSDERTTICNDIKTNWDHMRNAIRDLFSPPPRSTGSVGNSHWMIGRASDQDAAGQTYYMVLEKIMEAIRSGVFQDSAGGNYDDTANAIANKLIYPNEQGLLKLRDIVEYGKIIQEKTDTILNSESPECSGLVLKKFKWNAELENPETAPKYANLREFADAVKPIADTAASAYEDIVATRQGDSTSGCPSMASLAWSAVNPFGKKYGIFDVLLCYWADGVSYPLSKGIMDKASEWLLDSVGINITGGNSSSGEEDGTED